jgi:hypothetical protein
MPGPSLGRTPPRDVAAEGSRPVRRAGHARSGGRVTPGVAAWFAGVDHRAAAGGVSHAGPGVRMPGLASGIWASVPPPEPRVHHSETGTDKTLIADIWARPGSPNPRSWRLRARRSLLHGSATPRRQDPYRWNALATFRGGRWCRLSGSWPRRGLAINCRTGRVEDSRAWQLIKIDTRREPFACATRRSTFALLRVPCRSRLSASGQAMPSLGARRSALGARRSALGARRSALGARRSELGTRHSALPRRVGRAARSRDVTVIGWLACRSGRLISVGAWLPVAGDSRFQGNRGLPARRDPYYLEIGWITALGGRRSSAQSGPADSPAPSRTVAGRGGRGRRPAAPVPPASALSTTPRPERRMTRPRRRSRDGQGDPQKGESRAAATRQDRHPPQAIHPHHAPQLDKIGTRRKPVTRTTRRNSTRSAPAASRSPAPRRLLHGPATPHRQNPLPMERTCDIRAGRWCRCSGSSPRRVLRSTAEPVAQETPGHPNSSPPTHDQQTSHDKGRVFGKTDSKSQPPIPAGPPGRRWIPMGPKVRPTFRTPDRMYRQHSRARPTGPQTGPRQPTARTVRTARVSWVSPDKLKGRSPTGTGLSALDQRR